MSRSRTHRECHMVFLYFFLKKRKERDIFPLEIYLIVSQLIQLNLFISISYWYLFSLSIPFFYNHIFIFYNCILCNLYSFIIRRAAELLNSMRPLTSFPKNSNIIKSASTDNGDKFVLGKVYFQLREYHRVMTLLENIQNPRAAFLRLYSQYLVSICVHSFFFFLWVNNNFTTFIDNVFNKIVLNLTLDFQPFIKDRGAKKTSLWARESRLKIRTFFKFLFLAIPKKKQYLYFHYIHLIH